MSKVILLRFGELFLKGRNRKTFESALFRNIKAITDRYGATLHKNIGRYIVSNVSDNAGLVTDLSHVFGLVSLSIAEEMESSLDKLTEYISHIELTQKTFKVQVKRADKSFPMSSYELAAHIGGVILDHNKDIQVDVVDPELVINIEVREGGRSYVYYDKIPCVGGLPLGTAGRGLMLLSGGIDSPVAGYMMGKRGLALDAIHFHSFPYTSKQAKDKVVTLAKQLTGYIGDFKLYVIPFTKIQEQIHKCCDDNYMVILVRRFMMKISEKLAIMNGLQAIVTGENLAQVASQTVESMTVINQAAKNLPVLRPLVAFDKVDIVKIAKQIGTYETSILPYEDCCSVFLPDNPTTKPKIDRIVMNESKLPVDELIDEAISNIEVIEIKA